MALDCWNLGITAKAKGVTLCATQGSSGKFSADRHAISQILLNLVSNAIKFTPMGGTIEVGQEDESTPGEMAFYVRDNGRGIPAEQLSDVMTPFTQMSSAHVRDAGGVWVGSSNLPHSLAETMSGRVSIQSQLGTGTDRTRIPANRRQPWQRVFRHEIGSSRLPAGVTQMRRGIAATAISPGIAPPQFARGLEPHGVAPGYVSVVTAPSGRQSFKTGGGL
jgi:hypothetical protein